MGLIDVVRDLRDRLAGPAWEDFGVAEPPVAAGWVVVEDRGTVEYVRDGVVLYVVALDAVSQAAGCRDTLATVSGWCRSRGDLTPLAELVTVLDEHFEFQMRLLPVAGEPGRFALVAEPEAGDWRLTIGQDVDPWQLKRGLQRVLAWEPDDLRDWLTPEYAEA